jgi:chitodextrinase
MNLNLQIYVDVSGSPLSEKAEYKRLDLFDFEIIELTSTIQDIRDIGKVFTDYTQEFSVPASKNNNKIFKHYYNNNLIDGFDARIKQRARIYLNGIKFRQGLIRLRKSIVEKGKVESYSITFFGAISELKDILGSSELSSLTDLNKYNHSYDSDTVYSGFKTGLALDGNSMVESTNRDIVYPSISHTNKWFYDSSAPTPPQEFNQGFSVNLYSPVNLYPVGTYGINYTQLKPAIKVSHIISAIENKYSSIKFDRSFFGGSQFSQLYMLLHNVKGFMNFGSDYENTDSIDFPVGTNDLNSPFITTQGQTDLRPIITDFNDVGIYQVRDYSIITVNITPIAPVSDSKYTVELLDGTEIIDKITDVSGNQQMSTELKTSVRKGWDNLIYRVSTNENLISFSISLQIEDKSDVIVFGDTNTTTVATTTYSTEAAEQNFDRFVEITKHIPKMKVYDLLNGLFKQFNLTAEEVDGVIQVKPLDNYFSDGDTIDLTDEVDYYNRTVSRVELYNNITFEYSEPKTFGLINQNEISQRSYGDLEYDTTNDGANDNLSFDGRKYEIKLPFEKLFYETLSDENNLGDRTPISNGWLVDKDQNPVLTKPLLFFNVNTSVDQTNYKIGFLNQELFPTYNRASNSSENNLTSLHFNSEFSEYSGDLLDRSLFNLYYSKYIKNVFSKQSRIFKLKSMLSLKTMLSISLRDTIKLRNKLFYINNITYKLNTGEAEMELISKFNVLESGSGDITPPSVPQNLTERQVSNTEISFNWDASTDNVAVEGYKIYLDGLLYDTTGVNTDYTISGLNRNTTYNIQVSAFDAAGNESSLSASLLSTTANLIDTIAPTKPLNLTAGIITPTSIGLSWDASTDNVGILGYGVIKDGVNLGMVTNIPFYNATGLTSGTTYNFRVYAVDTSNNNSRLSSLITVTTT